jgi:hypothetical protein
MKVLNINDQIGKVYGRWVIVSIGNFRCYSKGWIKYVNCRCICGNEKEVELNSLKRGKSTSCGCYNSEIASKTGTTHGFLVGLKGKHSSDYEIWIKMKGRCFNSNDSSYQNYGGRGITVCDSWINSFENFITDLGKRPNRNYSLERIDSDKSYYPENCKWILKSQQSRNTRRTIKITYLGKTMCLAEWCKELQLNYSTIRKRMTNLKMPFEEAIKYPQYYNCKGISTIQF